MASLATGVRWCLRSRHAFSRALSNVRPLSTSLGFTSSVKPLLPQGTSLARIAASCQGFHTSATLDVKRKPLIPHTPPKPVLWPQFNEILYPPRKEGEPIRAAEVTHHRANIKYSGKKLWYIGIMIRGMSIDEAIKQLSFYPRKGAQIVKEILEEAQELAVKDHNVEFKSNLWVADAFHKKSMIIKGVRKGGRGRRTMLRYRYTHFYVRLQEGPPPKHYYKPEPTGHEKFNNYLQKLRERRIPYDL